jgi:xanthine phosphoribosyltransferase
MAKLYLTIEECFEGAQVLLEKIEAGHSPARFKGIVAILNGGVFPAYWLRKLWRQKGIDLPLQTIDVRSYKKYDEQGDLEIRDRPDILDGEGWLFVDEICDTGKTCNALRKEYPAAIYASLTCKTDDEIDYYALRFEPDQWVVFPWEMAEDKK